jgi:hypothetical protein
MLKDLRVFPVHVPQIRTRLRWQLRNSLRERSRNKVSLIGAPLAVNSFTSLIKSSLQTVLEPPALWAYRSAAGERGHIGGVQSNTS